VNYVAGVGDDLSFALTDMARDGYGINDAVANAAAHIGQVNTPGWDWIWR
jgi:hypothetical protein